MIFSSNTRVYSPKTNQKCWNLDSFWQYLWRFYHFYRFINISLTKPVRVNSQKNGYFRRNFRKSGCSLAPSIASTNQKVGSKCQLETSYENFKYFWFFEELGNTWVVHEEFISIAIKRFISRKAAVSKFETFFVSEFFHRNLKDWGYRKTSK